MKHAATAFLLALAVAANGLSAAAHPGKGHHDNGRHLGQLRRLQSATLSDAQVAYAFNHQSQNIARLRAMGRIDASRVRIVRLTAAQKARFHVSFAGGQLAYEPQVAQIFNTNNPLLQQLQQIVAGLIVTNAINQSLGGSSNGGATATLAQILLSSGIPLNDLLGVFFDPSGVLNAIVG